MKVIVSLLIAALMTVYSARSYATITFSIDNRQSDSLGTVTVTCPSGNYYVTVAGSTSASVDIPEVATDITINGVDIQSGQKTQLQLRSGRTIEVDWTDANSIVVIDPSEILMRGDFTTHNLAAAEFMRPFMEITIRQEECEEV